MTLQTTASACILIALASVAAGQSLPQVAGDMKHAAIGFDGVNLSAHVEDLPGEPAAAPVELIAYPDDDPYDAGGVLDGTYYSARYGWLAEGFITLDPGTHIWIEQMIATPGLNVYEGGMRMMRASHTYAPIFGTDGSPAIWQWGGTMVHNWYSVDAPGSYEATYRVYIGDASGAALDGYGDASVTFSFNAIPAPGASLVCGVFLAAGAARRRR